MPAASEYAGQRETLSVERSEVGGVTAAMIGSRSCFGYSASAPAVSAEMYSGPWD